MRARPPQVVCDVALGSASPQAISSPLPTALPCCRGREVRLRKSDPCTASSHDLHFPMLKVRVSGPQSVAKPFLFDAHAREGQKLLLSASLLHAPRFGSGKRLHRGACDTLPETGARCLAGRANSMRRLIPKYDCGEAAATLALSEHAASHVHRIAQSYAVISRRPPDQLQHVRPPETACRDATRMADPLPRKRGCSGSLPRSD